VRIEKKEGFAPAAVWVVGEKLLDAFPGLTVRAALVQFDAFVIPALDMSREKALCL
jgi:hypothetical protein